MFTRLLYNFTSFQFKKKVCLSRNVCNVVTYSIFNVRHTHETTVMEGDVAGWGEVMCGQGVVAHKTERGKKKDRWCADNLIIINMVNTTLTDLAFWSRIPPLNIWAPEIIAKRPKILPPDSARWESHPPVLAVLQSHQNPIPGTHPPRIDELLTRWKMIRMNEMILSS